MESTKILHADLLDIIFEGRNKEYGAYVLRKSYNSRLMRALMVTGSVIALLVGGWYLSKLSGGGGKIAGPEAPDTHLIEVAKEKPPEIPQPPKPKIPQVAIVQYTPPRIVKDNEVKDNEKPPEVAALNDIKIGTVNKDGAKDDGITAPPANDDGKGVVAAPKKDEDDYDKTFIKVEKESEFPGGMEAWRRFLGKNLRVPDEAINTNTGGTVVVQFIVDKEGNISDVQAVDGPTGGGLREEAVRVIRKSGKWTPAIQNGRQVKSYKRQPITFRIDEQ